MTTSRVNSVRLADWIALSSLRASRILARRQRGPPLMPRRADGCDPPCYASWGPNAPDYRTDRTTRPRPHEQHAWGDSLLSHPWLPSAPATSPSIGLAACPALSRSHSGSIASGVNHSNPHAAQRTSSDRGNVAPTPRDRPAGTGTGNMGQSPSGAPPSVRGGTADRFRLAACPELGLEKEMMFGTKGVSAVKKAFKPVVTSPYFHASRSSRGDQWPRSRGRGLPGPVQTRA